MKGTLHVPATLSWCVTKLYALLFLITGRNRVRLDSVNAKTTVLLGYVRVKLIVLLLFAYKARKIGLNVQKTYVCT